MIQCRLCGKEFSLITWSHLKFHKLTVKEYQRRFPNSSVISKELSSRLSEGQKESNKNPEVNRRRSKSLKNWYKTTEGIRSRQILSESWEKRFGGIIKKRSISLRKWYSNPKNKEKFLKGHNEGAKKRRKMKISSEELFDLYHPKKMSLKDIAKKFSVSKSAVHQRMKREGMLRRGYSKAGKVKMENKEYKEMVMRRILKSLFKRPTKLEQKFISLFEKNKIPLKYVGDGSLIIGHKNPDFTEKNGKKLCVEVCNKEEKSIKRRYRNFNSWQEYEQKRIAHFSKFGWKCLVLWEDELKNPKKLLKKIDKFI